MILLFPNLETLRLALTSNIVPPEITLSPATVSSDEHGRLYLETNVSLSRTVIKNLDKIGVKGSRRHGNLTPTPVSCWPQAMPVTKEVGAPTITQQTPVLFEFSNTEDLPILITEMLRLGNDRQSFRWFTDSSESDSPEAHAESGPPHRALLRVIGPPYYTLLRALDRSAAGTQGTIRAYLERSPRVWVEIGHMHPLANQLRVVDTQMLLIRSPQDWLYLNETPFQDVYDILQLKLPAAPVTWNPVTVPQKFTVPLRLTLGNAADVPELWVLRNNGLDQLDALVRDSDDRLITRLMFAVAEDTAGNKTVILRTRPSKLPPPTLPLEKAVAFKPYWKLPNLFVPIGQRLHPSLRRDVIRKLLADDPNQVVWLFPGDHGRFTAESLADSEFRSLESWVDYIIESESQPLTSWITSTRFDFETFICSDQDTGGPKNKPDRGDKEPRSKDLGDQQRGTNGKMPQPKPGTKGKPAPNTADVADYLPEFEITKPTNDWTHKRQELEKRFLAVPGSLDSPDRVALWPELAIANSGAGQSQEAAICWLNALWACDSLPTDWLRLWFQSEFPDFSGALKASDFDALLSKHTALEDPRRIVVALLYLTSYQAVPAWLEHRLPMIRAYLEKHESSLPVRAVWLAAYRLAQLSDSDVLGLARVRDRLLNRLLEQGLQAERDLPSFLRYAGHHDSERLRVVRDKALDLHAAVREWTKHIPQNLPYVDLFFAFALSKLGETTEAQKLVEQARKQMVIPISPERNQHDDVNTSAAIISNFLFKAFQYRVDQALAGKPHTGQLSPELLEELEEIQRQSKSGPNNPHSLTHYVISRMRDQSRILEPHEKLDPYSEWTKGQDQLRKELADLPTLRDPNQLADRIRKLFRNGLPTRSLKDVQFHVLHESLPLSPRVGESFCIELLQQVPSTLSAVSAVTGPEPLESLRKQGALLDRALFLAGHYDRGEIVKLLVDSFAELIHRKPAETRFTLINIVAGQCLRSLKRLGMRNDIDCFLSKLHDEVLRGAAPTELKRKYTSKPETWSAVLQTQLRLATGWLSFGWLDKAKPILDEGRNELLNPHAIKLSPKDYTELARAYVSACAQLPADDAVLRITELFNKMEKSRITNTWTTAQYYSRFHLNLVEDVILALASDEFALGPAGRQWLDADEYLVRRRIHADMKRERERCEL
jgi:hypothetical protein